MARVLLLVRSNGAKGPDRLLEGSTMSRLALTLVAALLSTAAPLAAQEVSTRALFESAKYQEVIDRVTAQGEAAAPADVYVAAQSLARLDRRDEARDVFRRLDTGNEEDAWTFVGRAAIAALDGNADAALEAATRATTVAPDAFHAQYQLGLVQFAREDFGGASTSMERATQLDGQDAYAHYYAGLAFNRVRRPDKMAQHFQAFVSLAPEAPERQQVMTILNTLRR
jgi:tetratricopeptide (TPR) repeat protein